MISESKSIILVVDDSIETLSIINEALSSEGYSVFVSMDGGQAISIARQIKPDMILLDAVMPVMDGFETCKKIKQDQDLIDIPVIFMTGLTDSDNVIKGLESGSVDYIKKPLKIDELIARIKIHLKQSRLFRMTRNAFNEVGQYAFICNQEGHITMASESARQILGNLASTEKWNKQAFTELLKKWFLTKPEKNSSINLISLGSAIQISCLSHTNTDDYLCRFHDNDEITVRQKLKLQFNLTERESEVLFWLSKGKTNQETAEILSMSPRTVNKHLEHIFKKMMVENRIAAVAMCHQYM